MQKGKVLETGVQNKMRWSSTKRLKVFLWGKEFFFPKIYSIKEFDLHPYEELMKNFTQLKNLSLLICHLRSGEKLFNLPLLNLVNYSQDVAYSWIWFRYQKTYASTQEIWIRVCIHLNLNATAFSDRNPIQIIILWFSAFPKSKQHHLWNRDLLWGLIN